MCGHLQVDDWVDVGQDLVLSSWVSSLRLSWGLLVVGLGLLGVSMAGWVTMRYYGLRSRSSGRGAGGSCTCSTNGMYVWHSIDLGMCKGWQTCLCRTGDSWLSCRTWLLVAGKIENLTLP